MSSLKLSLVFALVSVAALGCTTGQSAPPSLTYADAPRGCALGVPGSTVGGDHGLKLLQAPAARSAAEDIDGGARIRFVPADPAERDLLRAKLRERATAMNAQSCT